MFGIGFFELVVIAIVALIFVGPKKLPEFMKTAGRLFVQVRRTAGDVRSTFDQVVRDAEDELRREEAREFQKALIASSVPTSDTQADNVAKQPELDEQHSADGSLKIPQDSSEEALAPEGVKAYQPVAAQPVSVEANHEDSPTSSEKR